jgi:hypothetical protein
MWGHLFHWVKPLEQKQIVRIILFVPIYSQLAFWGLWFYHSNGYLVPLGQCYEGLALIALFVLYVQLVAPFASYRDAFLGLLERRWIFGSQKHDRASRGWFRVSWAHERRRPRKAH